MRSSRLVLAAAALLLVSAIERAESGASPPASDVEIDRTKIYHGDPDDYTKPGVISASKVYDEIPEYKEIKEKGLTPADPKYWILMKKADKTCKKALEQTETEHGFDLIGEVGSIKIKGKKVPDITKKVVEIVKRIVKKKSRVEREEPTGRRAARLYDANGLARDNPPAGRLRD